MTPKRRFEIAQDLFAKRRQFDSLCQEIAEHFYPQRARFTVSRDFDSSGSNLSTSYPVLIRRELGDQLGMMLRPTNKPWFHPTINDTKMAKQHEVKQFLEFAQEVMRRAMYDPVAQFSRATKETDHDFAAFGQGPMSLVLNEKRDALLYNNWNVRDVVWKENREGKFSFVARKAKMTAYELDQLFGSKINQKIRNQLDKKPFSEYEIYHIVTDAEMADVSANGRPKVSLYYDVANHDVIEEVPIWSPIYMIPRWQTVSDSQYAYSPATITALPDARLIQAMTWTLLEAGEKATNPPLVATQNAVRSDVSVYAGGITWVDQEYDERLGSAIRPIAQDYRGLPYGLEMLQDTRSMLESAFYLNKLRAFNPGTDPQMTAFQAGQLVQEYIRGAMPLFEPIEQNYNAEICEQTFDLLMRNGAFGPPDSFPRELRGAEITWRFESPLHDAIEQMKGQKFVESKDLIEQAMLIDENAVGLLDVIPALRDALQGIQVPSEWTRSEPDVEAITQARQAAQENAQLVEQMQGTASAAKDMSQAGAAIQQP